MFSKIAIIALAPLAYAANHAVAVGQDNGLTFTPQSTTAQPGDTVTFTYMTNNHSVTFGDFANACQPGSPLQFNSGFIPANQGTNGQQPSFTVNVASTNPIPVYCAQAQHCQAGMVHVINPSTNDDDASSLVQFQRAASQAKTNVPANQVTGGTLANFAASSSSSSSSNNNGNAGSNNGNTGNSNANANANASNGGNGNHHHHNKRADRISVAFEA
ncbi:MAG: hypothetical protein M1821_002054 [Bathelium mastoideum]|nr:MAG: hypothetical protein M1821_002054 [Bathelium mastoideum]KAI9692562.1 MAG: hypothetical protein M1822_006793 [Bathelium mastoideum]